MHRHDAARRNMMRGWPSGPRKRRDRRLSSSPNSAYPVADRGWKRRFDEPIPLPRGRQLVTLEDAGRQRVPPEGVFSSAAARCSTCYASNIRTRIKRLATGKTRGGIPVGRGAPYYLLSNHFYIGEVKYKNDPRASLA